MEEISEKESVVMSQKRTLARFLAEQSISEDDPTGWFEVLYAKAKSEELPVPWADMAPNPNLMEWLEQTKIDGKNKNALKIGCGLGDDAEALSRQGFDVIGFDISETAIAWCMGRFPKTRVQYITADLLNAPSEWHGHFDFVLESYTLQVLPDPLRSDAIKIISDFVAPGGTLLVICRARDVQDDPRQMPWPLLRSELDAFLDWGLSQKSFEDYFDNEDPPVRRFRAVYEKEV